MVSKKFKLVKVDYKYCDYKVCYNRGKKELRPYLGVLFEINDCEYFAPLSSPKEKHKNIPDNLDFNNMIPLTKNNYELLDLNNGNLKYHRLLLDQLRWLNRNSDSILLQALTLYNKYITNKLNIRIKKCLEYNKEIPLLTGDNIYS